MKILPKRRRAEGKTNYLRRKRMLEGRKPRIVIRKSNRYLILQYVESKAAQDKIKVSVGTKDILKHGWPKDKTGSLKSLAACYLAGLLFGEKIKNEEETAIIDIGLARSTKGSRIYAAVKGIADAKANIIFNEKVFPDEKRIKTDNVKDFFDSVRDKITKEKKKNG